MFPQVEAIPSVHVFDLEKPRGETVMEFRLVYRGPLKSNGGPEHKNQIRRYFHSQLKVLWEQHSGLRRLSDTTRAHQKHKKEPQLSVNNRAGNTYNFLYLIGEKHGLSCALDVLFLRRESAGGLFEHRGDLDNRLKTLFDALKAPHEIDELPDGPAGADENPFFCALEDDKYIDRVTITTDRLLSPIDPRTSETVRDVLLIIGVKTMVFDNTKADWWQLSER
jgi:hypothetical protein